MTGPLLLIACDRSSVVRSLFAIAGGEPEIRGRVETALREAEYLTGIGKRSADAILAWVVTSKQGSAEVVRDSLLAVCPGVADLFPGAVAAYRHVHDEAELRTVVVQSRDRGGPALASSRLQALAAMVNATAQTSARRDLRVMESVETRLVASFDSGGFLDFGRVAAGAARLAVELTGAHAAAVYTRGDGWVRDALHISGAVEIGMFLPTRIGFDEPELVCDVGRRKRAVQRRVGVGLPSDAILLGTPLPGPLASTTLPVVGVLVIHRAGRDQFSDYHQALARNLGLRLAMLSSASTQSNLARSISLLRNSSFAPDAVATPRRDGVLEDLPPDISAALAKVPPALEVILQATASHSVTVRLALGDVNAAEGHGLALVRVVAYPPERLTDPRASLHESRDGGLNWRAATTGQIAHAPFAAENADVLHVRPGTRSELAVPIRYAGKLVGTLNLESPEDDSYGSYLLQIQAVAGAIGRTLADAMDQHSQFALDRAAAVLAGAHDIDRLLSDIKFFARDRLSPELCTVVEPLVDAAIELLDNTARAGDPTAPEPAPVDLLQLVRDKNRALLTLRDSSGPGSPQTGRHLTGREAQSVTAALGNVLANLKKHTDFPAEDYNAAASSPSLRTVTVSRCHWDGRAYTTVQYINRTQQELDRAAAWDVYRLPIAAQDGTLRLGAFLAGLQIRSVGGLLHFAASSDGLARTVVMVPE